MSKHHHNERSAEVIDATEVGPVESLGLVPVANAEVAIFSVSDMEADSGMGVMQNVKQDDLTIPRIAIIQASSDELKRSNAKFIQGAVAGQLFNSLTREFFDGDTGVITIPCHYTRDIRQWFEKRMMARHPIDTKFAETHVGKANGGKGTWITVAGPNGPEEHELVETTEFFVLHVRPSGDVRRATIVMKSTALKVAKRWNSLIADLMVPGKSGKSFNPVSFGQVYVVTTVPETSKAGQDYLNFSVRFLSTVNDKAIYELAKQYFEDASKGKVVVQEDEAPAEPTHSGPAAGEPSVF